MTYITLAVIVCGLIGTGIFLAYYRWEWYIKDIVNSVKSAKAGLEELSEELEAKPEGTLPERFYRSGGVIVLVLLLLFPIAYLFVKTVFLWDKTSQTPGITIIAMIIIILITLVIGVFGHYEKNLSRKFWTELIVTLVVEIMVAFSFYYILESDLPVYRLIKSGGNLLVFEIPFVIFYINKTRCNWQKVFCPEYAEKL